MSTEKSVSTGGGTGFAGLLTVLFIGLKLTHYINWSWWWVLSPLWLGAVFVLAVLALIAIIAVAAAMIK